MRMPLVAVLVLLIAIAGLAIPAYADDHDVTGVGRMTIEGLVASISPESSTFVLRVLRPDFVWHFGLEYVPVWVQRGTRINDEDDRWNGWSAIGAFRPGDRVKVDGFRLDDGRLLALQIDVQEQGFGRPPRGEREIIVRGVVVSFEPGLLIIVDVGGGTRFISISSTTRIVGLRGSWLALRPHDTVVILGAPRLGTIAAREVQVIALSH